MTKLLVVGGGRMGEAIALGLARSGWPEGDLVVIETDADRRRHLAPGVRAEAAVAAAVGDGEVFDAVVAVKPHHVEGVCRQLGEAGARRALSVAAGVTLDRLAGWLGSGVVALRAMPNTPALIG